MDDWARTPRAPDLCHGIETGPASRRGTKHRRTCRHAHETWLRSGLALQVLETRQQASHVAKESAPGISLHRHAPVWSRKCDVNFKLLARPLTKRFPHAEVGVRSHTCLRHSCKNGHWSSVHLFNLHGIFPLQRPEATRRALRSSRETRSTSRSEDWSRIEDTLIEMLLLSTLEADCELLELRRRLDTSHVLQRTPNAIWCV